MAEPNRKTLKTWAAGAVFQYQGNVIHGTTIYFGADFRNVAKIDPRHYRAMLATFSGHEVSIGTSHSNPPEGSLGRWFYEECKLSGLTSYIGPILLEEGFAERGSRSDRILIKHLPGKP